VRYSHELRAGEIAYAYDIARGRRLLGERRAVLVHEVLKAVDCEAPCPASTCLIAELARQPSDGRWGQPEVRVDVGHPEPAAVVPCEKRLDDLERAPQCRLEIEPRSANGAPQRPGYPNGARPQCPQKRQQHAPKGLGLQVKGTVPFALLTLVGH